MRDTKLVNLLKGLSAEDFRQIRKMLLSPFYTSNDNLLALLKLLKTYHPQYESTKLEKQSVFKKLFPGRAYSDIKLRNLNSDLVHIIEDYLIYKAINANDIERRKALIKTYKNRGYLDWFERESKKLTDELHKLPYRDQIYYQHLIDLTILHLEHYEGQKLDARYDLLQAWEQLLEKYYELSKIRHQMAILSLSNMIKPQEWKPGFSVTDESIQFNLYRSIIELYRSEDLALFQKIREDFEQQITAIRPKFQKELLMLLINFAIKQMVVDDYKFNKIVLALYQLGLRHHLFFTKDRMTDSSFFNIVVCACKAKAFDWALEFIENYEDNLFPDTKEEIKLISLSTYYFHKKKFSKAIDLISAHHFKHIQIKSTVKYHIIRCYYELYLQDVSYYELFIAQAEAIERYFRRAINLTEEKLRASLHFLNFLKKLATMRLNGKLDKNQKVAMTAELSRQKITLSRSWLIDILQR